MNKNGKSSFVVSILIGLFVNGAVILLLALMNGQSLFFDLSIHDGNASDYIGIITAMISVVFITTSLLSTLSDKDNNVYWENTIQYLLINPQYMNLYSLSVYSYVSMFLIVAVYFIKCSAVVLGGSLVIVLCITVLFFRMTRVYFKRNTIKGKLGQEYSALVASIKEIKDHDSEEYNALKSVFDEKMDHLFMNTIGAIDGHQIETIEENLTLLLETDKDSELIDQIADLLLNIFQSIYERDKFLFVSAVRLYGRYHNVSLINDYLYHIITGLEEDKENKPFKNTLCELYVDALISLQGDLDPFFEGLIEKHILPFNYIVQMDTCNLNKKKLYLSYESGQLCHRMSVITMLYEENGISNIDMDTMFYDSGDPVSRAKGNKLIRKVFKSYRPVHDRVLQYSPNSGKENRVFGENIYSDYICRLVLNKPTKFLGFFRDFVDINSWTGDGKDEVTEKIKEVLYSRYLNNLLHNEKKQEVYEEIVKTMFDEIGGRHAVESIVDETNEACCIKLNESYIELIEEIGPELLGSSSRYLLDQSIEITCDWVNNNIEMIKAKKDNYKISFSDSFEDFKEFIVDMYETEKDLFAINLMGQYGFLQ